MIRNETGPGHVDSGDEMRASRYARTMPRQKPVLGWREWVLLPELSTAALKAKIGTGARTSALHAVGLEVGERDDAHVAVFEIHPLQRCSAGAMSVELPVSAFRRVRSSDGRVEERPVITTDCCLGGREWPIEVTLTARDEMGFRMLLGRSAVRRRFVIDPGRSFLLTAETS